MDRITRITAILLMASSVCLCHTIEGKWSEVAEACLGGYNDWSGTASSLDECKRYVRLRRPSGVLSVDFNGETCMNSRHNRNSVPLSGDFRQPCGAQTTFQYAERLDIDYGWTIPFSGCIKNFNDKDIREVDDMDDCHQRCEDESEFVCLSVDYKPEEKICFLSRHNRASIRSLGEYTQPCYTEGWKYSEKTDTEFYWSDTVQGCIRLNNVVHDAQISSLSDCQDRCVSETDFTCLSIEHKTACVIFIVIIATQSGRPTSDYTQPCYSADWTYSERVKFGSWTDDLDACIRSHKYERTGSA
ncbi:hypothetical protein BSL78_23079 [Apostichopus japonicus]|uniref:Apple domain-containing protein n=1 Tax=Stichopus japonicus TaxID=307972 RepID=A0A2G8JWF7_STIJA|nr:hypothetical protein BSL78_23079 [Apostichopus japonicus]